MLVNKKMTETEMDDIIEKRGVFMRKNPAEGQERQNDHQRISGIRL